ncbi:MAG: hypothetical protein M8467_14135, partial [Anaerolineae bacterium]|nr:hypothetical protein [Anaerolineae bacterium]
MDSELGFQPRVTARDQASASPVEWQVPVQAPAGGLSPFPRNRPRRLRCSPNFRRMMRETWLNPADLIFPLFVVHGQNVKAEISSMPGNYHWSIDQLPAEAEEIARLGIPSVILFGLPAEKDPIGRENFDPEG